MTDETPTLMQYVGSPALGQRYIEMNGITHLEVQRHHLGEPGFQLWVMSGTVGFPYRYARKRDAVADATTLTAAFPALQQGGA